MRKWALILLLILAVGAAGVALAQPPETDPTCDRGSQGHGRECAGDNGEEGCRGINVAEEVTPEQADDAMDLVTDILGAGDENDCDPGNDNGQG